MIPAPLHPEFFFSFGRVFLGIEFGSLGSQGECFFPSLKPPHCPLASQML